MTFAEHTTENAIIILLTDVVEFSEQLAKSDTFWVDLVNFYLSLFLFLKSQL